MHFVVFKFHSHLQLWLISVCAFLRFFESYKFCSSCEITDRLEKYWIITKKLRPFFTKNTLSLSDMFSFFLFFISSSFYLNKISFVVSF